MFPGLSNPARLCGLVQEEVQAAYTALQVAEGRSASLQTQLEAAPIEAAAAADQKVSSKSIA